MREVVKALGGVVATARLLGVTQPALSTWLSGYQRFPPKRLKRLRELAAALVRQVSAALPELERLQRENEELNRLHETRWKRPARGDKPKLTKLEASERRRALRIAAGLPVRRDPREKV